MKNYTANINGTVIFAGIKQGDILQLAKKRNGEKMNVLVLDLCRNKTAIQVVELNSSLNAYIVPSTQNTYYIQKLKLVIDTEDNTKAKKVETKKEVKDERHVFSSFEDAINFMYDHYINEPSNPKAKESKPVINDSDAFSKVPKEEVHSKVNYDRIEKNLKEIDKKFTLFLEEVIDIYSAFYGFDMRNYIKGRLERDFDFIFRDSYDKLPSKYTDVFKEKKEDEEYKLYKLYTEKPSKKEGDAWANFKEFLNMLNY